MEQKSISQLMQYKNINIPNYPQLPAILWNLFQVFGFGRKKKDGEEKRVKQRSGGQEKEEEGDVESEKEKKNEGKEVKSKAVLMEERDDDPLVKKYSISWRKIQIICSIMMF